MSPSQGLAGEGKVEMTKDGQSDVVEARDGVEIEEPVEDGRREVGAVVCVIIDRVASDLSHRNVKEVR